MKLSDIGEWQVIEAARAWSQGTTGDTVLRALSRHYPEKLVLRKIERMSDIGFLNYGVSPACAWAEPEEDWPRQPTGQPTAVSTPARAESP